MDVNTPLGGSMPIEATPVLTYSGLLLTSVAATSTHDYTVAFMGTATGHLKKVSRVLLFFSGCHATHGLRTLRFIVKEKSVHEQLEFPKITVLGLIY